MRKRLSNVSIENRRVGVDTAVTQEWPIAAHGLDQPRVAARDDDLLPLFCLGDVPAEWIRDEGVTEKLDAVGAGLVLMADSVWRCDVYAVGDGMRALDGAPRIHLRLTPFV